LARRTWQESAEAYNAAATSYGMLKDISRIAESKEDPAKILNDIRNLIGQKSNPEAPLSKLKNTLRNVNEFHGYDIPYSLRNLPNISKFLNDKGKTTDYRYYIDSNLVTDLDKELVGDVRIDISDVQTLEPAERLVQIAEAKRIITDST
jgi:hypothetical protein